MYSDFQKQTLKYNTTQRAANNDFKNIHSSSGYIRSQVEKSNVTYFAYTRIYLFIIVAQEISATRDFGLSHVNASDCIFIFITEFHKTSAC